MRLCKLIQRGVSVRASITQLTICVIIRNENYSENEEEEGEGHRDIERIETKKRKTE